jgi:hypothetical protein
MKTITGNLFPLPPSDFFAPPLQARAGLYATLQGQPGLCAPEQKIGDLFQSEVDASTTNT